MSQMTSRRNMATFTGVALEIVVVVLLQRVAIGRTSSRPLHLLNAEVERGSDSTLYTIRFTASAKPTIFWRNGADIILSGDVNGVGISYGGSHGYTTLRTSGQDEVISVYLEVQAMYYDLHFRQQPGRLGKTEVQVPTSGITFSLSPNVTFRSGEAIISTLNVPRQRTNYKINGINWQFIAVDDYDNPTRVVEYSEQADGESSRAPLSKIAKFKTETSVGARMKFATDEQDYEGILTVLVAVESTDDTSPVSTVDEGHVFYVRREDHPFPFPAGFVGFISNSLTRGRVCHAGVACNIPCLAVGVGLRSMKLYTKDRDGMKEVNVNPYNIHLSYMLYSEFTVPGPDHPGLKQYVCRATSDTKTADYVIDINFEES